MQCGTGLCPSNLARKESELDTDVIGANEKEITRMPGPHNAIKNAVDIFAMADWVPDQKGPLPNPYSPVGPC